jgi:hypothetical protein
MPAMMTRDSSDSNSPLSRASTQERVTKVDVDLADLTIGVGGGDEYIAMLAQEARLNSGSDEQAPTGEQFPSRRVEVPKGPPYRYTNG